MLPGNSAPVLMLRAECSLSALKSARSSCFLPADVASVPSLFLRSHRQWFHMSYEVNRSAARSSSAPCCLGWCVGGTAGQMAPGRQSFRVRVQVRLSALGSCSCLHCTTKTNKVVLAITPDFLWDVDGWTWGYKAAIIGPDLR